MQAKSMTQTSGRNDRINCITKSQTYIKRKDHKENLRTKPTYRLINLVKKEIGKIS